MPAMGAVFFGILPHSYTTDVWIFGFVFTKTAETQAAKVKYTIYLNFSDKYSIIE